MNMILHDIEAPNIIHTNTLEVNNNDIQEKDRHDVILANPPFGGRERTKFSRTSPSRHLRLRFSSFSISFASLLQGVQVLQEQKPGGLLDVV
jgi:type I restriction-modification system DNA methylase subunit